MIRVDRARCHEQQPIRPSADWFKKAADATALLEGNGKPISFNRDLYTTVDAVLLELFHWKCAYCEHQLQRCDVEHYRPKSKVRESPGHPGYYWLAYTWDNLLPSCEDCNRERRGKGTFESPQAEAVGGKSTSFPLRDEAQRVQSPSEQLDSEPRLLLHPCWDDPEEHIAFAIDGSARPHRGSLEGETSINTYHLNRPRLRMARRNRLQRLKHDLAQAQSLDEQRRLLESAQREDRAFAGCVRSAVRVFEAQLLGSS